MTSSINARSGAEWTWTLLPLHRQRKHRHESLCHVARRGGHCCAASRGREEAGRTTEAENATCGFAACACSRRHDRFTDGRCSEGDEEKRQENHRHHERFFFQAEDGI